MGIRIETARTLVRAHADHYGDLQAVAAILVDELPKTNPSDPRFVAFAGKMEAIEQKATDTPDEPLSHSDRVLMVSTAALLTEVNARDPIVLKLRTEYNSSTHGDDNGKAN